MSQMSLKLPRLGHQQRKRYLESHYGTATNKELALACGVHESTIKRDIAEWKDSGDYDEWLDQRWHELLESDAIHPTVKFKELTKLKLRRRPSLMEHLGTIAFRWDTDHDDDDHDSV